MTTPLLHVVLYQPDIPQNTGNIGRTCAAVGAKLWLIRPLGFRLDEKHLRRAGMDYWRLVEWEAVDSWSDVEAKLPGCRSWCLTKTAHRPVWDAVFEPGDVLLFGSETRGLPASILEEQPAPFGVRRIEELVRRLEHQRRELVAVLRDGP